jgi:rubredoxin
MATLRRCLSCQKVFQPKLPSHRYCPACTAKRGPQPFKGAVGPDFRRLP